MRPLDASSFTSSKRPRFAAPLPNVPRPQSPRRPLPPRRPRPPRPLRPPRQRPGVARAPRSRALPGGARNSGGAPWSPPPPPASRGRCGRTWDRGCDTSLWSTRTPVTRRGCVPSRPKRACCAAWTPSTAHHASMGVDLRGEGSIEGTRKGFSRCSHLILIFLRPATTLPLGLSDTPPSAVEGQHKRCYTRSTRPPRLARRTRDSASCQAPCRAACG